MESWLDPLFREILPAASLAGRGERYQDLQFLGEGATAKVYKAMDTLLLRSVALKLLKNPAGAVLEEGRAQAKIEHPNVCRIYEVGQGYLIMELVEGATLHQVQGGLDLAQKVALVRDVALGVHAAHQSALVHLDLKPGNILVRRNEAGDLHPMIGDFGMVLTSKRRPGIRCPLGTPPYSSPEQLRGDLEQVDRRSDVYSLGMVLYVILAGRHPFGAIPPADLPAATAGTPPAPLRAANPKVPVDLARVVHTCLEKRPEARYADAQQLAQDLDRFLQGQAVRAMGTARLYRSAKWVRRNRRLAVALAMALAVTLGVSAHFLRLNWRIQQQGNWDHHFQALVEEARTQLDRTYRKPAHDVEPELAAVRSVIQRIEGEMAGDPAAQGPGHLAIGQVNLLLGTSDSAACQHFQNAWTLGFRTQSARAWLAYALVRRVHSAQGESKATLLDQARQLVAGRRNTEQVRISHLLDLADLASRRSKTPDEHIAVARAYRQHVPDDLDAVLEEAQAIFDRTQKLHEQADEDAGEGARSAREAIRSLLDEAEDVLAKAYAAAPSHPDICRNLALVWIVRDRYLPGDVPERRRRQRQVFSWLDRGRACAPRHRGLRSNRLAYLCTLGLELDLLEGTAGRATWTRLKEELDASIRDPKAFDPGPVLEGIALALEALPRYGLSSRGRIQELLEILAQDASKSLRDTYAQDLPPASFSRLLLVNGWNPEWIPSMGPALEALASRTPGSMRVQQHLALKLEYHRLLGKDTSRLLAQYKVLANPSNKQPSTSVLLQWVEARCTDAPAAWRALVDGLETSTEGRIGDGKGLLLPMSAEINLAAARHAAGIHVDPARCIDRARAILDTIRENPARPNRKRSEALAELRLLEAMGQTDNSKAESGIAEGLRQCRLALAPANPSREPISPAMARRSNDLTVDRTRLLTIQGELHLRRAQLAARPDLRARSARLALAAFRAALAVNPLTARELRPLQDRGQALLSGGA